MPPAHSGTQSKLLGVTTPETDRFPHRGSASMTDRGSRFYMRCCKAGSCGSVSPGIPSTLHRTRLVRLSHYRDQSHHQASSAHSPPKAILLYLITGETIQQVVGFMRPKTTCTASRWHTCPSRIPGKGKSYNVAVQADGLHPGARGQAREHRCSFLAPA